jgi:hypothetical protein
MTTTQSSDSDDNELIAIGSVLKVLKELDTAGRQRVFDYVAQRLSLQAAVSMNTASDSRSQQSADLPGQVAPQPAAEEVASEFEGISLVATKWIRRNGLNIHDLGAIFSLGADEIDLVAKSIPEKSKKARTRNVALLKAVAEYLSTGAARISSDQLREACLHYDAFDSKNHASYLKDLAPELGGSKEGGYSLTARGLTSATELIKMMLANE